MFRTFVSGKIHRLRVSGLRPKYNGSCLICPELLAAAGIEPFEKVEIYSLTATVRIATYVFPGAAEGEFTLNGGAALHFQLGDRVVVVARSSHARLCCRRAVSMAWREQSSAAPPWAGDSARNNSPFWRCSSASWQRSSFFSTRARPSSRDRSASPNRPACVYASPSMLW